MPSSYSPSSTGSMAYLSPVLWVIRVSDTDYYIRSSYTYISGTGQELIVGVQDGIKVCNFHLVDRHPDGRPVLSTGLFSTIHVDCPRTVTKLTVTIRTHYILSISGYPLPDCPSFIISS